MAIKTHFNLSAADYEAHRTGHLETRRSHLVESLLAGATRPALDILEIGCGAGKLTEELADRFPGSRIVGIDIETKMIDHARQAHLRPNLSFELADAVLGPQADAFDAAVSVDVIHHVHEQAAFFTAVRRALRPGGLWIVIEPNIYHPYMYYHQGKMKRRGFDEDHFRPWTSVRLWEDAGFRTASRRYAFAIPNWIRKASAPLAWIERGLEGSRFFGGSVVYTLIAR